MKSAVLILVAAAVVLSVAGCQSSSSLERGGKRKKSVRRHVPAPSRREVRKNESSEDPAFDMIFNRKPQKHEATVLSGGESERMRRSSEADAAAVKSVRKERLKNNTRQKDWVFGTKDGKYF